jgi:hypothetical protein
LKMQGQKCIIGVLRMGAMEQRLLSETEVVDRCNCSTEREEAGGKSSLPLSSEVLIPLIDKPKWNPEGKDLRSCSL